MERLLFRRRAALLAVSACFVLGVIVVVRNGVEAADAKPTATAPAVRAVEVTFAQELPADAWQVTGKQEIVDDEILGGKVVEIAPKFRWSLQSTAKFDGDYVVEALVRFPGPTPSPAPVFGIGSAALRVGVVAHGGKAVPAYSLTTIRKGERNFTVSPTVGEGNLWTQPLRPGVPLTENIGNRWLLNVVERFPLENISPVWDEEFRIGIENDMLGLPRQADHWRRLRIEVRSDRVRMYHDGLLAFDEPRSARTDGAVLLELTGPARVAKLSVAPLAALHPRFEPVVLDDLVNAAGLIAADSLPPAQKATEIAGVPLLFPARTKSADHVDVGRSLFRYRRSTDADAGDPNWMWPTIGQLDPARLRVRVPRGAYSKLWIVAACDDESNSVPMLTVRFYKPRKGWAIDAAAEVPSLSTSTSTAGAKRVPVRKADGGEGSLWLVPIELDAAAQSHDLRDEMVYHIELTKEIKGFRASPDPMFYGYFQGGLPSAVRVFAMTLERAPVTFNAHGNRPGHTYPHPEVPVWEVDMTNPHTEPQTAQVKIEVTSPYGETETTEETMTVGPGRAATLEHSPRIKLFGLHTVKTTVTVGEHVQSRSGRFVSLPPDTRKATGSNSRWGLWYWNKGHDTHPVTAESMQLFRAYGSFVGGHAKHEDRLPWKLGATPHLAFRATPAWALEDPYDPAEYAKYSEECGLYVANQLKKEPDLQYVSIFAEHSISLRVTHGTPPEAFNKPWYEYTPAEQKSIKSHFIAAKAAFEGVRKHAPNVKFFFGHCGPLFSLPFMRDGYDKNLFDGYGVDSPQFERMPERTPRAVECNFMYFLNKEMKERGYDKELVHVESYYPPSHPLALGLRESADSIARTAVLSLANGTDRFLACWTLDDPEGAWGSQHYGAVGILERGPEMNPKPGATNYATLTAMLDTAKYDGYVATGSRSAYCVRFKETPTKNIYANWTIRGKRPLTVALKFAKLPKSAPPADVYLTDEHGNETRPEVKDGKITFELSPTVVWLTTVGATVESSEVGPASYDDAPGAHRHLLADFERGDELAFTGKPDERYATNSWDMPREPAPYTGEKIASAERGSNVLRVTCDVPTSEPNVTGRYGVFAPSKPMPIPGRARALGMWANGNSGWGRFVYEIVDAKGEVFQSIGTKDQWNCDDVHSWSNFNFDGWRYVEFPLPSNSPGDDYREQDSVWWNHSAEGIVDLPVSLTKVIFEMPTHQIYVDEMLPIEKKTVEIDDLQAVYDTAEDLTDAPVKRQRDAAGSLQRKSQSEGLPNPIADSRTSGVGPATKIVRFYAPEQFNDGTRIHAAIAPVAGATEYQVWVSAYADGRGAKVLAKGPTPEPLVNRLRPGIPLYFFATYTDAAGKPSQASDMATITLKDEFLQK